MGQKEKYGTAARVTLFGSVDRNRKGFQSGPSTLNAFFFEALNERNHFALFRVGHLELRQSRGGMTEKYIPVALTDAHAFVGERHVSAAIVHWAARARAKEVDEELLFPHYAILSAMRPEAPELWIGSEPWQEIICHCGDCVISAKALVQSLRRVITHSVILKVRRTPVCGAKILPVNPSNRKLRQAEWGSEVKLRGRNLEPRMAAMGQGWRTDDVLAASASPPIGYPLQRTAPLRPLSSIEYDAVTNPNCSRRSDHGVHSCARELAEIANLHPIVANECPKNIRILR